jgi:hypothetical protein
VVVHARTIVQAHTLWKRKSSREPRLLIPVRFAVATVKSSMTP